MVKTVLKILLLSQLLVAACWAQDRQASSGLRFVHTNAGAVLPFPGDKITMQVWLSGTKDTDRDVRMMTNIDGKLITIPMHGELDSQDRAVYYVTLFSPLGELDYQFVLFDSTNPVTSQRYTLARSCLPPLSMPPVRKENIDTDNNTREVLWDLIAQTFFLEKQVKATSASLDILERLQEKLQNRPHKEDQ